MSRAADLRKQIQENVNEVVNARWEFLIARFKLTFWYTSVVMLMSLSLTGIYFFRTTQIINLQYARLENRLENREVPNQFGRMVPQFQILRDEFSSARRQIRQQLIAINLIVLGVTAGASFFLSGKTLDPIQRSIERQKQFITDAAHELKTPLTAIQTSLEVSLLDTTLPKKARQVLQENLNDISSLESLTRHLLTLARAEKSYLELACEVSIQRVVERAQSHVEALAKKKKIKLTCKPMEKDWTVLGNENSLVDALLILLDNAIKYTPEKGSITIEVKAKRKNVFVLVSDTGIGIAKSDLSKIFDRFYRVEASRHKDFPGGYGLGLAVAQKIIQEHEGSMTVKSTEGHGSVFGFQLKMCGQRLTRTNRRPI